MTSDSNNNNATGNELCHNTQYDVADYDANFGENNICTDLAGSNTLIVCSYECPKADLYITKTVNKINATGDPVAAVDIGVTDILLYTITYGNTGGYKGKNVTIIDNIPLNTIYLSGTANASNENVTIQYSTDWGTTWLDSEPKAETVTRIKWLLGNVSAGETGNVSFRVQVYGGAGAFAEEKPKEVTLPTLLAVFVEYTEKNVLVVIGFAIIFGAVAALVSAAILLMLLRHFLGGEFLKRKLMERKRRKKREKRR